MLHLVGVLVRVQAVGRRLPDLDSGVRDGLPRVRGNNPPMHKGGLAIVGRVEGDGGAVGTGWGIVLPGGTQDRRRGHRVVTVDELAVGNIVDETAEEDGGDKALASG